MLIELNIFILFSLDFNLIGYDFEVKLLIQSKIMQLEKNIFQCADCDHTSNYKSNMVKHVEDRHIQQGGHVCKFCEKICPSRNALSAHISRKHRNTK